MKLALEGVLLPPQNKEKYWSIGIPLLHIYTQGRSKKNALEMIKEAVESAVDVKGFTVEVEILTENSIAITSTDFTRLIGFMLRQQRQNKQMSLRQAAKKLGSDSPNEFSRYEQSKSSTSLEKLAQLMSALNDDKYLLLKTG